MKKTYQKGSLKTSAKKWIRDKQSVECKNFKKSIYNNISLRKKVISGIAVLEKGVSLKVGDQADRNYYNSWQHVKA